MDYNHKKLIRRFGSDCFEFTSHGCYGSFEPDKIPLKLEMRHVLSGNSVTVTGFYTQDYEKAQRKCYSLMWDVMKKCPTKTHLKKLKKYRHNFNSLSPPQLKEFCEKSRSIFSDSYKKNGKMKYTMYVYKDTIHIVDPSNFRCIYIIPL